MRQRQQPLRIVFYGRPQDRSFYGFLRSLGNNTKVILSSLAVAQLAEESWPAIYPAHTLPLKSGMRDPSIAMIRDRLMKLGDLKTALYFMVDLKIGLFMVFCVVWETIRR